MKTAMGRKDKGRIWPTDKAGHLVFGPHISLSAGEYEVDIWAVIGSGGVGEASVEIAVEQGTRILAVQSVAKHPSSDLPVLLVRPLKFSLDRPATDVEIRIDVSASSDIVFDRLTIRRME